MTCIELPGGVHFSNGNMETDIRRKCDDAIRAAIRDDRKQRKDDSWMMPSALDALRADAGLERIKDELPTALACRIKDALREQGRRQPQPEGGVYVVLTGNVESTASRTASKKDAIAYAAREAELGHRPQHVVRIVATVTPGHPVATPAESEGAE